MNKTLSLVAFLGAITVILGAFGAHTLQDILNESQLKSFETAVRYQMFHVIVLLFVNTYSVFTSKSKNVMNFLFFVGILFFSGSIYAITFGISSNVIWPLTPLGGLFLILGWLKMGITFFKKKFKVT